VWTSTESSHTTKPRRTVSSGSPGATQYADFRGFLDYLEPRGKLVRVKKEVDTRFDIAAGIRKVSDTDGPALLYENVRGFPGWRVAAGVFATRKLLAHALEVPEEQMQAHYERLEQTWLPPVLVDSGPVQDVVWTGDEIDLTKLPICVHSEYDAGPYITIGIQYGEDPETGAGNLGIHRQLVLAKDKLTVWSPPDHHLGRLIMKAEDRGEGLPIVVIIGADPRIVIASQVKAPLGVDEMAIAGGMRGAPIEVVRCKTLPINAPAHAEVIIEGVTIPGERVTDGPFAEYTGCYSASKQAPTMRVTAITMRRDPIFHTCLTGLPVTENHVLIELPNMVRVSEDVRRVVPEVRAINVTPGGTYRHHVVVSIKKRHPDEARNVILALLSSGIGIKQVTVVDEDIDVYNPVDVEWALATRMQPDEDIIVVPRLTCSTLDPSVPTPRSTAGWGIDATRPPGDPKKFEKVRVPGVDQVDYV
jgi:2,5-furandicarboxylate decarboxylase 1